MNIFALVKDPQRAVRRIAVSQQLLKELGTLFESQAAALLVSKDPEVVAFDGSYTPDEDEVLEIANFAAPTYLLDAIKNPIDCPAFEASDTSIAALRGFALASLTSGDSPRVLLQKFDQRRAITNRGFTLWHSQNTFKKWEGVAVTFDDHLTAILDEKRLLFRSFFSVRQLFDMSSYFAEATDPELEKFQKHSRVTMSDGVNLNDIADGWIRRRVAMISESGILDSLTPNQLAAAAAKFKVTVNVQRVGRIHKIVLLSERKSLKPILHFLADDLLESALTDAKYLTNSKRRI